MASIRSPSDLTSLKNALDQSFDDMVAHNRRSTKSHSGIWRDLAVRKRKTEAEAQLGPIIKVGQKNGIATPLTSRLMAMVLEIEAGDRRLGDGKPRRVDQVLAVIWSQWVNIEFEGKTVIVTGAAHGIGRAIAASFVTHGAQVFACDVNTVGLAETQRICGDSCETVLLDVGDQVAVQTAVSKIEVARNGIDILVNNAGMMMESSIQDTSISTGKGYLMLTFREHFLCRKLLQYR